MRRSGFRNASIVSRLKALLSVVEDFVRSDAASLGKTGSGATWENIRGSWAIATNKASTSTAGSSYPISTLTFTQEDVTISVGGVGPGMGTAFWVTDSNNWWGAYIDGVQTCQTCTTPGNPSTYAYNYVSGGNCATYSTVPGNCATYSTVPGNCATYSTVPGNCATYSTVPGNCATYSTVPGNCSTYSTSCSYPCNATNSTAYPCNAFNKSYPCNAYNPVVPGNCASANASNCNSFNTSNCNSFNAVVPGNCASYNSATPGNCASWSTNCNAFNAPNCAGNSAIPGNPTFYNARTYNCPGTGNSAPGSSCGLTFAQAQACGGCKTQSPTIISPSNPTTYTCSSWNSGNCKSTTVSCTSSNSPTPGNCASTNAATGGNCNSFNAVNCNAFNASNCNAFNPSTGGNCATWSTVNANCATYATVPGNCSTYSTSCSYPCNATNATSYPCNAVNSANYPCNATNATAYPCNATNATAYPCNAVNSANYPCNVYNPVTYATVITAYNAATYYTCNCVTDNKIKIIKMIAGTLTTVATLSFASAIASFKAILSGDTITIQAFTGTNYTTQIGTNQATIVSGYTKTKKHGILKGVVTYAPSDTSVIDEFRVG